MPIDPQTDLLPADPSQWWQTRSLPRIIVHPDAANGPPDNSAGADGIDDWFVPGTTPAGTDGPDDWFVPTGARADTSYPDDWFVPAPSAMPNTAQPAPEAQPNAANPGISDPPAARPDPLAAYWSLIPASRAGAPAWHPPVFPNSLGQFPLTGAAPLNTPRIDPTQGLLGALANLPATNIKPTHGLLGALANLPAPNIDMTHGLLGALAYLQPSNAAALLFQRAELAAGHADQAAPPSLLQSSSNLAWPPPPSASDGVGIGVDQPNFADLLDHTPDLETGSTPSQTRDALSLIGNYLRANQPEIARIPTDIADMFRDAVTDFPEFMRRAEPGLAGLGLSAPARTAGNVWLLNDTLRGRIAEVVHGRNLPFNFPVIDRFLNGIATSIKSINLNSPYYQNPKALYYKLRGQINAVADFIGGKAKKVVIEEHQITGRRLDVLVPHGGSAVQKSAIEKAIEYGAQQGVTVNIIRHQ